MTQDERDERAERDARDGMRKFAMFPRGDGDSSCRGWDFAAERSDVKSHEPKMANGVRHPPPLFSCFRAGAGLERVGPACGGTADRPNLADDRGRV